MDFLSRRWLGDPKRPREESIEELMDPVFERIKKFKYSESDSENENDSSREKKYKKFNKRGQSVRVIKGIEKELPNEWRRLKRQAPRADIHWFRSILRQDSLMFVFDNENVALKTCDLGNEIKLILPDHTPSSISLPDSSSHLTVHYIRMDGVDALLENLIDLSIDLFELVYLLIQALRIAYVLTCKGYLMSNTPIFGVTGLRPDMKLLLLNFYTIDTVLIDEHWDATFPMVLRLNLLHVTNIRNWKILNQGNQDNSLNLNKRLQDFVNSLQSGIFGPEVFADFISGMKDDLFNIYDLGLTKEQVILLKRECSGVLSIVP